MTDYLEQVLEGTADALREAQRKLERTQYGQNAVASETQGREENFQTREILEISREIDRAGHPDLAGETGNGGTGGPRSPEETAGRTAMEMPGEQTPMDEAEAGLPLSAQVLRAERMAGAGSSSVRRSGGLGGTEPAALFEARTAARPGHGREQNWAEQMDRAFRRDSRRYDGGFFLY